MKVYFTLSFFYMKLPKFNTLYCGPLLFILSAFPALVNAEERVELIQALSFGTIVVGHNRTPSSIEVSPVGNVRRTNQIWMIEDGHNAEFLLTGYPAYKQVNIRVEIIDNETRSQDGITEQFKLTQAISANFVTTDGVGSARVLVGGTLETTGNNQAYFNTDYSAQLKLIVEY